MLHKTRGIVLYTMPYSDRFSVARVFTEEFGVVSYLVPQSRSRKTKMPRSLFLPLSVLEMEVVHHSLRDIHQLKEARPCVPLNSLYINPVKNAISVFVAEFIAKVVRETAADRLLFGYLVQSLKILELSEKGYANFHLVFTMRLSRFLGIFPDEGSYHTGSYFDMQNGVFTSICPPHNHYLSQDESRALFLLLRMNYNNMHLFRMNGKQRNIILARIIEYYRLHLAAFPDIKSLEILTTLFSG